MITELIDTSLAKWGELKANSTPGVVPEAMQTGESEDDWTFWKAINSTVTDRDIAEINDLLGVDLSPQYIDLLRHKHFMELQFGEISILPHPVGSWKQSILKEVFSGYPKELLIEKGFLPFASYNDWGLLCFGIAEKNTEGEYPIYRWDHDRPQEFEFIAPDLESALQNEITKRA